MRNALIRTAGIWTLLAALAGCGDGNNVIKEPIGSRCSSSDECGTRPYNCVTAGYPGGYCQKDCSTDGDCPSDSVCVTLECRRKCRTSADCRASEGYVCRQELAIPACDLPTGGGGGDGGA